jgi:hypothetical protein
MKKVWLTLILIALGLQACAYSGGRQAAGQAREEEEPKTDPDDRLYR